MNFTFPAITPIKFIPPHTLNKKPKCSSRSVILLSFNANLVKQH